MNGPSRRAADRGCMIMFGILVVTHGNLADELVKAARMIIGEDFQGIQAISIGWNDEVGKARREILEGIESVSQGYGVLILTDMFGGTPTNLSLSFLEADKVEIITGVNLPMLIKLFSLRKEKWNLVEAAQKIRAQGQKSIHVASDILNRS